MTPYSWYQSYHRQQLLKWGIKVIEPPIVEQISLEEARLHLRLDDDGSSPPAHPDDPLITVLIQAARQWCEFYLGRAIATQTLELGGTAFTLPYTNCCQYIGGRVYEKYIELPMCPVISITSVTYLDSNGIPTAIPSSDYVLDDYSVPPRLYAAMGVAWPTPQASPNSAKIRYVAGYDLPGVIGSEPLPATISAAMKLMLGHLYENRSEVEAGTASSTLSHQIPMGAAALLDVHRVRLGIA